MSTAIVMEPIAELSPRLKAKIAGVFYLVTILARMFVEIFVRNRLVVSDNAAATASNILAHQPLWRLGFATDILSFASYVALTALLYELLKPVNPGLSVVAAFFGLAASVVHAISSLFHFAPLVVLGGGSYLSAFTVEQLQALALVFLKLRAAAYHNIGLVFFGLYLLLVGILILRSTFLPRILGVLMVLAGLSYVPFLSPTLARSLQPYILVFPAVGQISLTLWLLVMGINAQRWKEQVGAALERVW
jgi:hypothetical protein